MVKDRPISIEIRSRKLKLTLWEGTEDEEKFPIKSVKRGTPYVIAYGVRYDLTDSEIRTVKMLQSLASEGWYA